jgi:hypothetical protein
MSQKATIRSRRGIREMASREPARRALQELTASVGSLLRMRRLPAAAAVLSVLLALPALGAGWILDNYYRRTVLLQSSRFRDLLGNTCEW